ncbi:hypothetical protein M9H77_01787 [Catharanthus roseus]|uniref:Uncharacterized protein n=1 Tax=Catharanthus roseus TaxID=4058 RepID=A0ACC0C6N8_CATRO|nr:hypothetical protein M9H77_01787 [Catharanthus roseus]
MPGRLGLATRASSRLLVSPPDPSALPLLFSLSSSVLCFFVVHRPSMSPCLSIGEVRELARERERERERGRRLPVIPFRLRPVSKGYNSRSSFSLPSTPRCGSAAARRLFSGLVTLWFQLLSHLFDFLLAASRRR